jgi:hypothetical protein
MTKSAVADIAAEDSGRLRERIYAGEVLRLPQSAAGLALAGHFRPRLEEICGGNPRDVHERMPYADLFGPLSALRAEIAQDPSCRAAMRDIAAAVGEAPADFAFDALRLRCVMHDGHKSPASERAYAAHRDTWFWNPQAQVNFWIALHDVTPEEAFLFYPSFFDRPVENTSGCRSYDDWMGKTGWQGAKQEYSAGVAEYPKACKPGDLARDADAFSFAARAGDVIVFSGAHLHRTAPNATGRTRFSLDFRAVHRADHAAGRGAPNADNKSSPDALADYVY